MAGNKLDLSHIDGYAADIYWELVENKREDAESQGNDDMAQFWQDKLQSRPNWTYDSHGMMISYEE